jgi:D-glycero-D-manno-heptose 1,7-bisphosphate phosphatase
MKRAAVFFDRDNTLIANDGYLGDPNGVVLVHGAADAIARARAMGYAIVVFSNQSGVARGLFTEEAVHAVNHRLDEMLQDENPHAVIDRHEFCPYHRDAEVEAYRQDSDLRKPKPGMILQAERQLALDLPRSWVIGDAPRDIDAGKAAGCKTILVTNPTLAASPTSLQIGENNADYEVRTLAEAMEVIARDAITLQKEPAVEMPAPAVAVEEPQTPEPDGEPTVKMEEPAETAEELPATPEPIAAAPVESIVEAASEVQPEPVSVPTATPSETEPVNPKGKSRTEIMLGQILEEMRRRNEHPATDFSVSKLLAGVVQVLAIAAALLSYLKVNKTDFGTPLLFILAAIFLQAFTISLLIMGRQK